jgi:drug/metabolite transporter (DMT)-like permease
MDASIASTLLFVYPIMVTFMMAAYYKERVTAHTLLCLAMAVGGVALMYNPESATGLNLAGAALVLVAALAYAIYIVGINTTRLKGLATLKVIFYVLVFGTVIFAARLYVNKQVTTPAEWYQWGNLLALAFFPTVVSLACTTRAIRYIGSTPTAILGAFEPVTAVLFCVLILGETLTMQEFGGILLVILSVTLVVEGGKFTSKIVGFKKLFPKLPKDRIHK